MAKTDKTGRAGEHFVAAELCRRGVYATPFSGNLPGIDILATDDQQEYVAYIQVKTKQTARQHWQASLRQGWVIPNASNECLCLDTCDDARCTKATGKEPNHPHHRDATNLLTLPEVQGKQDHFWVFVSLEELQYWIVPDHTVRHEMIRRSHIEYLQERGGHRPGQKHGSLHFTIRTLSLTSWLGRWSTLGLGLEDSTA